MTDSVISLENPFNDGDAGTEITLGEPQGGAQAFKTRASFATSLLDALVRDTTFGDFVTDTLLALLRVIPAEAASLLEARPRESVFRFRGVIGQSSDRIREFQIPLDRGIAGEVARTGKCRLVEQAEQDPLHLKTVSAAVEFRVRNIIAVPVYVRGELFGVIELLNRVSRETFQSEDLELLQDLVDSLLSKTFEARLVMGGATRREPGRKAAA